MLIKSRNQTSGLCSLDFRNPGTQHQNTNWQSSAINSFNVQEYEFRVLLDKRWSSGTKKIEFIKTRFELDETKNNNSGTRIWAFRYTRSQTIFTRNKAVQPQVKIDYFSSGKR